MNRSTSQRLRILFVHTALLLIASGIPLAVEGSELASGKYSVTQSWSQEKSYKRPYYVNVPRRRNAQKLPVFLFLHGNGGNPQGAMHGFLRRHPTIASRYITVFPEGYLKSWNIVSERSQADDRGFIESIIQSLSAYDNVQADNVSIMGSSNGSALVNQLLIECKLKNIRNYVAVVSPLNVFQHDGKNFKAKGVNNNYQKTTTPLAGKRILSVSGTEDPLVPYRGGLSRGIPAKRGKLGFVPAETSIFLWAKAMGYQGRQLDRPSRTMANLAIYSYLAGDVVHYKVNGEGHGAGRALDEATLLRFLENKKP